MDSRHGSATASQSSIMSTKPGGSRQLVVCDLLCYMVNKFARLACKQLKSTVCDFYTVDDISLAKEKLSSAIDELQIDKFPKMVRRRKDSINRSKTEVDDIFLA